MNRISILCLGALAAAPLAAQQPMPPMGHMMGDPMAMQEMMGPMMQVMLYTPQHLLARKDALGLTPDQIGRLTTLRTATQAAQDAAMGKAHWLALASAVQGRAILNDAQRAKLKAWADSMQTWMQQHRQMMKPGESH